MEERVPAAARVLHEQPATAGAIRDFDGKRKTENLIVSNTGSLQRRAFWPPAGLRDV
jgi:hypothetical protein